MHPGCGLGAGGGVQVQAADYRGIITIVEGAVAGSKGRIGCAVDLGLVIDGDGQSRLVYRQGAVGIANRVVCRHAIAGGDGIHPGCGLGAGGGAQIQAADYRGIITIVEGAVARGKDRVGGAVDLGFIVGGDGQSCLVYRQGAVGIANLVVGRRGVAGGDGVHPGCGLGTRGGAQVQAADYRTGVTIVKGAVAGSKGRVGCAVNLGLVIGGDGQCRLIHGQDTGGVADLVVGRRGVGSGDGVHPSDGGSAGGGTQAQAADHRGIITIVKSAVAGGQSGIGCTVDLGFIVGGDGQGCLIYS